MSYPVIQSGRFTEKKCAVFVEDLNERLAAGGSDWRMEVSPRNGYCAIDIYKHSVRSSKPTPGWSCVERNLETGSPRKCAETAREFYYNNIGS